MKKLLASAVDKENLEKLINEFYCSENYIITEDNQIYNTKTKKTITSVKVVVKKSRWRLEMI